MVALALPSICLTRQGLRVARHIQAHRTSHSTSPCGRGPALVRRFAKAKPWDQLLADWLATAALERFLEIVGEGVKRLPLDLRSRYPSVPWKEIAGTRDHLSHGYDDVDYQVLWDAVQTGFAGAPHDGRPDASGIDR